MFLPPPGAPAFDASLEARLEAAGASGDPPRFANRLLLETSPYLLQHAHNPVNWFPWGEEAFATAKALGRPVMLSVGYATCHWCHVMERESFEDPEIARFLNERYVCIKVDREERPDVDAIYMTAVQALSGSGGWPMTVWMTPEQRPFYAGTYFPARDGDRGGSRGFLPLLGELSRLYAADPARIAEVATSLTEAIRQHLGGEPAGEAELDAGKILGATAAYFVRAFDPVHGGTQRAPKFPSNMPVRLLLRHAARTGDAAALHAATFTLEKMAGGGLYDQLAGGFHRYSTDALWLVPHFEKMLYDNALLTVAYVEAHQLTGRADFARVARETLDYLLREMRAPEGGFYAATDADSEGEEGKFFVWSEAEIRALLGADGLRFTRHYGVSPGGNFEGQNILHTARPSEEEWAALAPARATLLAARAKRIPPLRDEKILASWNGLAISAFALGGQVLNEPRFVEAAACAADFVLERMQVDGRLMRSFKDGRTRHNGYLDDHAFLIQGLLDLFEATFDLRWLREALALSDEVEKHFADVARGAWLLTRDDHEVLLAREKPSHDGAEPSGSSVQLRNVARLAELTQREHWRGVTERALAAFAPALAEQPISLTEMLLALDFARSRPREIVLVWPDGERPEALLAALARTFVPSRVIAGAQASQVGALAELVPLAEGKLAQGGAPTAYVCELGACRLPTCDPAIFEAQLRAT